jgi:hypothetical protein
MFGNQDADLRRDGSKKRTTIRPTRLEVWKEKALLF